MTGQGYIDTGDRVVITAGLAEPEHARSARPEHVGKHGVVESNDGWGRCEVLLDCGARIMAWNGKDLELEPWAGAYPGFCRDPEACRGLSHCPREFSCVD